MHHSPLGLFLYLPLSIRQLLAARNGWPNNPAQQCSSSSGRLLTALWLQDMVPPGQKRLPESSHHTFTPQDAKKGRGAGGKGPFVSIIRSMRAIFLKAPLHLMGRNWVTCLLQTVPGTRNVIGRGLSGFSPQGGAYGQLDQLEACREGS